MKSVFANYTIIVKNAGVGGYHYLFDLKNKKAQFIGIKEFVDIPNELMPIFEKIYKVLPPNLEKNQTCEFKVFSLLFNQFCKVDIKICKKFFGELREQWQELTDG